MTVSPEASPRPVERFHRLCEVVVAGLPLGLNSIVAPTFLGFVVLNSFTFAVDLVLLTVLHGGLGVALPVAVTVAYACAFTLSYVLNRILNFRSHGAVGPQFAVYVRGGRRELPGVHPRCLQWAGGSRRRIPRRADRGRRLRSGLHVQRDAMGRVPALNGAHRLDGMPNTANRSGSRNTVIAVIPPSPAVRTCIAWARITPSSSRR